MNPFERIAAELGEIREQMEAAREAQADREHRVQRTLNADLRAYRWRGK